MLISSGEKYSKIYLITALLFEKASEFYMNTKYCPEEKKNRLYSEKIDNEIVCHCMCGRTFKKKEMLKKHLTVNHLEMILKLENFETPNSVVKNSITGFVNIHISKQGNLELTEKEKYWENKGVIDLTKSVSNEAMKLLAKGLKYVPLTKTSLDSNIRELTELCRSKQLPIPRIVRNKWRILKGHKLEQEVKLPNNVWVTKADKGNIIILIDKDTYRSLGLKFLSNATTFVKTDNNGLEDYTEKCKRLEEKWRRTAPESLNKWEKLFSPQSDRLRDKNLYVLIKLHKGKDTDGLFKVRPITDSTNTYTSQWDSFLSSKICKKKKVTPANRRDPLFDEETTFFTVVNSGTEVLKKLRELNRQGPFDKLFLVTADVSDMYNQIPLHEAVNSLRDHLEEHNIFDEKVRPLVCEAVSIVLSSNVVKFNNKWFKQIQGLAMGGHLSPWLANNWLHRLERQLWIDYRPKLACRYLDDLLLGTTSKEKRDAFLDSYGKLHKNIKLEINLSEKEVDYLDMGIYVQEGRIETKVYFKPTDNLALLHRSSSHPSHTFSGIIESQILRFSRICSNYTDWLSATASITQRLLKRGYSWEFIYKNISKTLEKINRKDWPFLNNVDKEKRDFRTLNVLHYCPLLENTYKVVKKKTKIAFRNNNNLRRIYCKSEFPGTTMDTN